MFVREGVVRRKRADSVCRATICVLGRLTGEVRYYLHRGQYQASIRQ